MDYYQEFKDLYYKEIEHSDRISSKITTIITFLTVIATADIFFIKELAKYSSTITWYYGFFLFFCLVAIAMFIMCLVYFYKTYYKYEYHYMPIDKIDAFIKKVRKENSEMDSTDIDNFNRNVLQTMFTESAIQNQNENVRKQKHHQYLINWIIRSFIVIIVLFFIWVVCWSNIIPPTA